MNSIIDTRCIRTVWVDLDDTIIAFRGNSRRALSRVHAVHPAVSRLFPDAEAWIEAYERHNHQLWALYNRAEITCAYLRDERFIRPLADAGMPRAEAAAVTGELDRLYLDLLARERTLVNGARDLLSRLRGAGLTVGVLSNGFADVQHRKIASAGIGARRQSRSGHPPDDRRQSRHRHRGSPCRRLAGHTLQPYRIADRSPASFHRGSAPRHCHRLKKPPRFIPKVIFNKFYVFVTLKRSILQHCILPPPSISIQKDSR